MNTSKTVEISVGATFLCGVVHVPVACDELCFVNAQSGLGLLIKNFRQSNKDGVLNFLSIINKTKLLITIQRRQQVGLLHLKKMLIPGFFFISSFSSSLTLNTFDKVSST